MRRLCVFCGSNKGKQPAYSAMANELGRYLAVSQIALVYGGGNVGLMGLIADAVMSAGGEAIGVIPQHLAAKELAHEGLTELRVVNSMHERKALMADLSDGFIAMPGGFGTFEEFFEIVTWLQLGLHKKPCGLLNVKGFYDPLLALVTRATEEGFIRTEQSKLVLSSESPPDLITQMKQWTPPLFEKWIDKNTR